MRLLDLELNNATRRYRRGSSLDGVVRAPANVVSQSKLIVSWHTEGKGDRDEAIVHELALVKLPQKVGLDGTVEMAFSVRLPIWPVTYHGELLKIHWQIALKGAPLGQSELLSIPFEVVV